MYAKVTAIVLVAALAAVLITSATLAGTDDASAKKKQKLKQINRDCGQCANAASQIQGDGNDVSIRVSIRD
jgi:hypothetical protein